MSEKFIGYATIIVLLVFYFSFYGTEFLEAQEKHTGYEWKTESIKPSARKQFLNGNIFSLNSNGHGEESDQWSGLINSHASDGWELFEIVTINGNTIWNHAIYNHTHEIRFVFRRKL